MAKFWKKIMKSSDRGEESSKKGKEGVARKEAEKAPEPPEGVGEKTRERTSPVDTKAPKNSRTKKDGIRERAEKKVHEVTQSISDHTKRFFASVGEKAPKVAGTVADKTKTVAAAVGEKTGEAVAFSKLKLRLHNLNRDNEKTLSEMGGRTYELFKQNQEDVYEDKQVKAFITKLQSLKKETQATENEIEKLRTAKKKPDTEKSK